MCMLRMAILCCCVLRLGSQVLADDARTMVKAHPDWVNALKPSGEEGPELSLAVDGTTRYRIVLPAEPTTQDIKAAEELTRWLGELTGADFPVVREAPDLLLTGTEISIGRTRLLNEADIQWASSDLGEEGYGIAARGERLFLFGGSRRGPINAVLALLEEDLGCRWYVRETATIPHRPTLRLKAVNRRFVPELRRRDPYYSDAHQTNWSLRNRTASHAVRIPAEWGGYPRFPMHFVHTYNLLMPPEEFFDAHPEYFSEIDGARRDRQLCPTHPEVQRIMIERVLARLASCPDCRYVDVSPNDWRDYCECERCRALDEPEGTQAASMLQLVNAVADAVAKVRPDVRVTTLAYLGTVKPPKTIRPRDNVQIVLCTDCHAWDYPLLPVSCNPTFVQAITAWGRIGADMKIWDYAIDFSRYMPPLPNLDVIASNMRFFVDHGVSGIFEQGSHGGNYGVDRCRLRCWVWAKQMWDITRDTDPLVRDFYYGFYGQAAEPLYEYDRMLNGRWRRAYTRLEASIGPNEDRAQALFRGYREAFGPTCIDFDDAFIMEARAYFDQALALAEGDRELTRRVEYASLPILYLECDRGPQGDRRAYLTLLNEFERIARRENAIFIKDAYGGPDLDRRLRLWRGMALINPDALHSRMLDNAWQFKPDPENAGVERQWFAEALDDRDWGTVRSDLGHRGWESQGFAEHTIGYGWYRQSFEMPENIAELPNLRLFFGAVDEQAVIWINGKESLRHTSEVLGLSKDFLWNKPFLFDPKPYLRPGRNQLTVRAHNALHVGGIYRPVYLIWGDPVEDLRALNEFLRRRHGLPDLWLLHQ